MASQLLEIERQIEAAAVALGRLINGAGLKDRRDLKELAHTMIDQEVELVEAGGQEDRTEPGGTSNLLVLGLLFMVVGAGLSLLFTAMGVMLAAIGLITAVIGFLQIVLKKRD
jgi:hypothetical protein